MHVFLRIGSPLSLLYTLSGGDSSLTGMMGNLLRFATATLCVTLLTATPIMSAVLGVDGDAVDEGTRAAAAAPMQATAAGAARGGGGGLSPGGAPVACVGGSGSSMGASMDGTGASTPSAHDDGGGWAAAVGAVEERALPLSVEAQETKSRSSEQASLLVMDAVMYILFFVWMFLILI